jgi:hypothetical protein
VTSSVLPQHLFPLTRRTFAVSSQSWKSFSCDSLPSHLYFCRVIESELMIFGDCVSCRSSWLKIDSKTPGLYKFTLEKRGRRSPGRHFASDTDRQLEDAHKRSVPALETVWPQPVHDPEFPPLYLSIAAGLVNKKENILRKRYSCLESYFLRVRSHVCEKLLMERFQNEPEYFLRPIKNR